MIDFKDAQRIVDNSAFFIGKEKVDFRQSLNRVLAEDVISDIDLPPFDKSAMDGFACRRDDLHKPLKVLETIAAGQFSEVNIGEGECVGIMTGAPVPEGADVVIMVEHTEEMESGIIRFTGQKTANNIAYKAEDVKTGEVVLKRNAIIKPQHIAILASVGCVDPVVAQKPQVAVMSTGSELVEPAEKPDRGQIRNSNSFQLISQIDNCGCGASYYGIIPDDEEETAMAIGKAIDENDVVILTGGVSMGEYDFVPDMMKKNGIDILFSEVAVKPGKPTVFGKKGSSFIFGLPGNPVSSFIIFELIVKPFLYKMMGYDFQQPVITMSMHKDYKRKKVDRTAWIPVNINQNGEIVPAIYHGSGHIHALCNSYGIISMPKGVCEIKKGEKVDVRPL